MVTQEKMDVTFTQPFGRVPFGPMHDTVIEQLFLKSKFVDVSTDTVKNNCIDHRVYRAATQNCGSVHSYVNK